MVELPYGLYHFTTVDASRMKYTETRDITNDECLQLCLVNDQCNIATFVTWSSGVKECRIYLLSYHVLSGEILLSINNTSPRRGFMKECPGYFVICVKSTLVLYVP